MKSYSEMCRCGTFEERLKYLQLHGTVGKDTFGFDRYLNQDFTARRSGGSSGTGSSCGTEAVTSGAKTILSQTSQPAEER